MKVMNTLHTSAYWNQKVKSLALAGEAVPVGITLYHPRRNPGYPLRHNLKLLAPDKALFKIDDYAAFRVPFLDLLELRWPFIQSELENLSGLYPELPLILLCFDRVDGPGDWCHRQIVAEFLAAKLAQPVTEL